MTKVALTFGVIEKFSHFTPCYIVPILKSYKVLHSSSCPCGIFPCNTSTTDRLRTSWSDDIENSIALISLLNICSFLLPGPSDGQILRTFEKKFLYLVIKHKKIHVYAHKFSVSFFSSSDMHKSRHLDGRQAMGDSSSFIFDF